MVLIRHGQASFGSADYDVLSELGIEQSRCLGDYFGNASSHFDALYCGPRKRHRDTAAHMRSAASERGLTIPEPIVIDDLDELPAFELIRHWRPIIERDEPDLARAIVGGSIDALDVILARWADGSLDSGEHETFAQFDARVRAAIDSIREREGRGKTIAVVTSGGPITISARYCLDLSPAKAMSLLWSVTNSSLSELRYRSDRARPPGLYSLNRVPHLGEPRLITKR